MKTYSTKFTPVKPYSIALLFALLITASSCKKDTSETIKEPEKIPPVFTYEVNCDYCSISYIDGNNQTRTVSSNIGKWSYKIDKKISFDMKLVVTTILSGSQAIQAYILKDDEVVFGNLGYNRADITYSTIFGNGTSSFGSYVSTTPATGGNSGGTTTPYSSVCGAANKTGGYCKRVVVGGGRCWQHK